jgi:S1-C subfamily serine protease
VRENIKGAAGIRGDPRFLKIGILINSQNTGAPIITAAGEVVGILNIEDQGVGALLKTQRKSEVLTGMH